MFSYPTSPSFTAFYPHPPTLRQPSGGHYLSPSDFNRMFSSNEIKNVRLNGRGESIRKRLKYVGMVDDNLVVKDSVVTKSRSVELRPTTKAKLESTECKDEGTPPAKLQYKLKNNVAKPVLLKSPVRGMRNAELTRKGKLSRCDFNQI